MGTNGGLYIIFIVLRVSSSIGEGSSRHATFEQVPFISFALRKIKEFEHQPSLLALKLQIQTFSELKIRGGTVKGSLFGPPVKMCFFTAQIICNSMK